MRSRAYRSVSVNHLDWKRLVAGRDGQRLVVGVDIGKYQVRGIGRWPDGAFDCSWRVENPHEIPKLVELLRRLAQGRQLVVAMEPSGTYGDALRQALHDAGIAVQRVSTKVSHDYAEVFDGVPSQHDGKDAAIVAELAALGKGADWPYQARSAWEQELVYWVERMDYYSRMNVMGLGQLEALLGRHWPEATQVLEASSGTLLRALEVYGSPAALAADPQAAVQLTRWGGKFLSADKVQALLAGARMTAGVRATEWDSRQLQEYGERTRVARREVEQCKRNLKALAKGHEVLQAQGKAVGLPTACVLWVALGDPRNYPCGRAYRKAMGLNLVERSSGIYQGKLKISKRGNPRSRRWLYLATMRLVRKAGVLHWYQAKKARDGNAAGRALVAVMRKLALALHQVGAAGATFEPRRLFAGIVAKKQRRQKV